VNLHPSALEYTEILEDGAEVADQLRSPSDVVPFLRALGLSNDVPVCVYDDGGGYLASRIWWMLDYLGHPRRRLLDGGLVSWLVADGELSGDAGAFTVGTFVQRPCAERRVEFSDIIASMGDPRTVLCNTLDVYSFYAQAIPGSINIPYTETLAEDNMPLLKSRHELESMFVRRGVTRHHRLVCYCQNGYSAAQVFFAARYAGFPKVAVYDGSMADWSARGGDLVPGRET
jgi:thiosulfate/3-mercaptopyruvate sulfurtransferase